MENDEGMKDGKKEERETYTEKEKRAGGKKRKGREKEGWKQE